MKPILRVERVGKVFNLIHNRGYSLKSKVISFVQSRYAERVEKFHALEDVSLELHRGEAVALLGRNGSGKSTLLRIAAGIFQPSTGRVVVEPGTRFGTIIELGVGFNSELTGRENIFLSASLHGLLDDEIEKIYPEIVAFSGLEHFMDVPLKNYSTGMQARLGFSLESSLWPDALMVDEVLSVGDAEFQKRCMERMRLFKQKGGSILLVTHGMGDAEALCDRGYVLEHGKVVAQGPIQKAVQAYQERFSGMPQPRGVAV
jgi:ABC-2 type transport system ATP-binding protein/lipopolysaccharide transport system ATP-binding protein